MQRIPVDSSDLVSVGYDELAKVLEIEFKEDRIYQYFEVPKDIYKGLIRTDSPGSYFFSHINAYFRYRKAASASKFHFGSAKTVTFVTGNPRKLRDMQKACVPLGITIKHQAFDIDEIQAHDPMKIANHKAAEAFRRTGGVPTIINDAFWAIPALGGFPGGYMKDVMQWFTAQDFLDLMKNKTDRSILCTDTLIYKDSTQTKVFSLETWADIADTPRGKGNAMEQVVIFRSKDKTIAESHENGLSGLDVEDDIWYQFATWFAEYTAKKSKQ